MSRRAISAPTAFAFLLPPVAAVRSALVPLIRACINVSFTPGARPRAAATHGTNELLQLAKKYSLTAPMNGSGGKVTTLEKALTGARAFLQRCSPAAAIRSAQCSHATPA